MSGLSTRGLADGFVRGFSVMDNYTSNQQRREQSEKMFDRQESEWDREDAARVTQAMYEGVMSGNIDPEIAKQFEAKTGHVRWTDYIDPEFGRSLATMNDVLSGKADINTPEGIAAVNRLYDQEIKRGVGEQVGNKKIVDKMVNRVIPTKDGKGFMLNLAVKEEDESGGWSVRNAPVTGPNRSATDQEVKQIDLEQALSDLKGKMMVYQAIQSSPKLADFIRQRAAKLGAKLPEAEKQYGDPEQIAGLGMVQRGPNNQINVLQKEQGLDTAIVNGQMVDKSTGNVIGDYRDPAKPEKPLVVNNQVLSPDGTKVIGDYRNPETVRGGGQAPSEVRTAEWMVASGMAPNLDVAWNRISESKHDPSKFVSDFVDQELAAQESARIRPGHPDYRSTEDMRKMAIDVLRTIQQETRGQGMSVQPGAEQTAPNSPDQPNPQKPVRAATPQDKQKYFTLLEKVGSDPAKRKQLQQHFINNFGSLPEGA